MSKIKLDKKVNNLIRKTIIEAIQDALKDPDIYLNLQDWVKIRLKKTPKTLISFEALRK